MAPAAPARGEAQRQAEEPLTLFLVAGEASGDRLGAGLMRALRAEVPAVRFLGVGGPAMADEGIASLFDHGELSVMGLAEVVPRLPRILGRLRETTAAVVAAAPDALVTIDSPGFSLRLARAVRRRAPAIPTIHYVAPSVWAWRPGRARRMAGVVDHVMALLPFEPPFFEAVGVSCDFVGHPAACAPPAAPEAIAALRSRAGAETAPLLLLAPGSRGSEIRRMMPLFADTLALLRRRMPSLRVVLPVAAPVAGEVRAGAAELFPVPVLIGPEEGEAVRQAAFAAADAALVTSGSVVLELAAADTPMVSCYRANPLTAAIMRRLARVDSANLVNLVAGDTVVPEFLQENCVPGAMALVLERLLTSPGAGQRQREAFSTVTAQLGRGGGIHPSVRAARSLLGALGRPQRSSTST